jgi:hypothetical protein
VALTHSSFTGCDKAVSEGEKKKRQKAILQRICFIRVLFLSQLRFFKKLNTKQIMQGI